MSKTKPKFISNIISLPLKFKQCLTKALWHGQPLQLLGTYCAVNWRCDRHSSINIGAHQCMLSHCSITGGRSYAAAVRAQKPRSEKEQAPKK